MDVRLFGEFSRTLAMAMRDQRTFLNRQLKRWVAQVGGSHGFGFGWDVKPEPHEEMVLFTCLDDEELPSQVAWLPAGQLNRIGHSEIVRHLELSQPFGSRVSIRPVNVPAPEERDRADVVEDAEKLRWTIQQVQTVRLVGDKAEQRDALLVRCLDDTALVREVLLDRPDTYAAAQAQIGRVDVRQSLVESVKRSFERQG